jgi:hypothetical protein
MLTLLGLFALVAKVISTNTDAPLTILVSHQMGSRSHVKFIFDILHPMRVNEGHNIIYATTSDNVHFSKEYNYTTIDLGPNPMTIEDLNEIRLTNPHTKEDLIMAHTVSKILPKYFEATINSYERVFDKHSIDLTICDFFAPSCVDASLNRGIPVILATHGFPLGKYNPPYLSDVFEHPDFINETMLEKFIRKHYHNTVFNLALKPGLDKMNSIRRKNNFKESSSFFGHMDKALVLSNTFTNWDLATAVPGNIHLIGPIDTDETFIKPITPEHATFLKNNEKVMVVAFGTHLMLSGDQINKLLAAILSTLDEGIVDGVVWALNLDALGHRFPDFISLNGKTIDIKQKLAEYKQKLLISAKIPQYSLLKTNQVKLLMTHGGMETLHESFFTGTPTLILPFVADQPYNAQRVQSLEIGDSLILDEVDSYQLVKKIKSIINSDKIILNTKKIQLLAKSNSKKIRDAGELIKTYANYNKLCSQTKGWRDFICELEPYLLQQPTLTESKLTPKHYFGLIVALNVVIVLAFTYAFLFPFIKKYTKEKTD